MIKNLIESHKKFESSGARGPLGPEILQFNNKLLEIIFSIFTVDTIPVFDFNLGIRNTEYTSAAFQANPCLLKFLNFLNKEVRAVNQKGKPSQEQLDRFLRKASQKQALRELAAAQNQKFKQAQLIQNIFYYKAKEKVGDYLQLFLLLFQEIKLFLT